MQLWNKHKISVFANSWKRSRVILIEKHFKPIWSKVTSSYHSVTIRKRWFVKWAMYSGLIPGGQNLSNRQTVFFLLVDPMNKGHKGNRQIVFFLLVDPMNKEHKDLDTIELKAPRLAQCMHRAWKKHQTAVYWVDINLPLKRIELLSDAIECNRSSRNTSSVLHSKSCYTEDWRSPFRKSIHVTSTSTKDLITPRMDKEIGFESCSTTCEGETVRQPEGEVLRQTKFFQSTQPTPNPIRDRSGRLDRMQDGRKTSRSQEIDVNSLRRT